MSEREFWQELERLEGARRNIIAEAQAAHQAGDWLAFYELGHCVGAYWNDMGMLCLAAERLGLTANVPPDALDALPD